MTFKEWLVYQMEQRGWNQADLADEAGISRGAVSHIFSGARHPGIDMLNAMSRALQLPAEQVFRAAGVLDEPAQPASDPPPPNLGEWIHMFLQADEQTREVMLDNARYFSQREARSKKA